jgi:hypothetical protein
MADPMLRKRNNGPASMWQSLFLRLPWIGRGARAAARASGAGDGAKAKDCGIDGHADFGA